MNTLLLLLGAVVVLRCGVAVVRLTGRGGATRVRRLGAWSLRRTGANSTLAWAAYMAGDADVAAGRLALERAATAAAGFLFLLRLGGGLGTVVGAGLPLAVAVWRRSRIRRFRRETELSAAALADSLAAAFEMTGSAAAALQLLVRIAPPEAAALVRHAAVQASHGIPAMSGLRAEAVRFGTPGLGAVTAAVERAAALGVPVAPRLRMVAAQLRGELDTHRQRRAGRMVPLSTLISAMVIAPACVVVLAVVVIGSGFLGTGLPSVR